MKKILLISLVSCTSLWSFGQIEIYQGSGSTTDIAGTTLNINLNPGSYNLSNPWYQSFIVKNTGATDRQFQITRVRINALAGWLDDVCWPPSCFTAHSAGDLYVTPHAPENGDPAPIILAGTTLASVPGLENSLAEIKPMISPNQAVMGTTTYKYYVTDATTGEHEDSLTLVFSYSLSAENLKPATTLSMAPNPATDYVNITVDGIESSNVKIVDVLGNVVYAKEINSTSKISVSDFKSGVYFVSIEGENNKKITKKLIVRH